MCMRGLVRVACGITLAGAMSAAFAPFSSGRPTGQLPPGSYPVGTVVTGICHVGAGPGTEDIITRFQEFKNGAWDPPAASENSAGPELTRPPCTWKVASPGLWRIYVTDYHPNGKQTISYIGPYRIGEAAANPCTGKDTEVVSVSTPNGGTSGLDDLQGHHLSANQTLTATADVNLDFGDGSRIAIEAGSSFKMDGCSQPSAPGLTYTEQFSLLLGKIWSKITPDSHNVNIRTERVVAGNRGTIFWISYVKAGQITTLHVDEGSVWMRSNGRTITITAGHTATQQGTRPAVVRPAPINTKPPF